MKEALSGSLCPERGAASRWKFPKRRCGKTTSAGTPGVAADPKGAPAGTHAAELKPSTCDPLRSKEATPSSDTPVAPPWTRSGRSVVRLPLSLKTAISNSAGILPGFGLTPPHSTCARDNRTSRGRIETHGPGQCRAEGRGRTSAALEPQQRAWWRPPARCGHQEQLPARLSVLAACRPAAYPKTPPKARLNGVPRVCG